MRSRSSFLAILLVAISCAWLDMELRLWETQDRVIEHDVHGYYGYLPALFIFDDIGIEKSDYRYDDGYYLFWVENGIDGKHFMKYTSGLAMLYAPFFFIGHHLAPLFGEAQNGISPPYKIMLIIAGLFYMVMGLLLTRSILKRFAFSEAVVAFTLLLLGLGTNLFCYASHSSTMPHAHSFFLVAAFIYLTQLWYERATWQRTILIGATFGLLTLVRSVNAVIGLFFILYAVKDLSSLKLRSAQLMRTWKSLFAMALVATVIWVPQFLYWHYVTGEYFFYSYQDEGFFFSHPHILDGLFSFRKGWLVYTPIMAFALIGIPLMRGAPSVHRWALLTILALHIYIAFSWWCWWYGGTYGQRSMIDIYPLLAIPLCAMVDRIKGWPATGKVLIGCLALFLIWLNVFQTLQFEEGSLHHDGMTQKLYWRQFGKMEKIDGFYDLVESPDYEAALKGDG